MSKPKVLILTDWFVPGFKAGGPITSVFNMIANLNTEIDFSVFTRNTDWFDDQPYDLISDEWIDKYGASAYYSSRNHLSGAVKALSMKVDVLYFNGFYSPLFNAIPLMYALLFRRNVKVIVAPRGMLNQNAIAIKTGQKKLLIKAFGFIGIEKSVLFHATSEKEAQAIRNVYPNARIKLVSNLSLPVSSAEKVWNASRQRFLSVGRISSVKNTFELINTFSKLKTMHLKLVGTEDDMNYEKQCFNVIDSSPNISAVGGKNADEIKQEYQNADFFISMTSGENFGHAIIEALSFGCPVIISDQTPWNDLEQFGAGWVVALEDTERWETVLNEAVALSDADYAQMSEKAMAYVKTRFNFEEIRSNYLALFDAKS